MPTGITISKRGKNMQVYSNVYYTPPQSVATGLELGVQIANAERLIFGNDVEFINVHAWIIGTEPNEFDNVSLSMFGNLTGDTPLSPWNCCGIKFGVANSYPSYKYYRVQVNSTYIAGDRFTSLFGVAVSDYLEAMVEYAPYLCNRDGVGLGEPSYSSLIEYRKPTKRWYNKEN